MRLILSYQGATVAVAEVVDCGHVWMGEFTPAGGYARIESIVVTGNQASCSFGFLGPVADPRSDIAGRAAIEDLASVCSELTVATESGQPVNARVIQLNDSGAGGGKRSVFLAPNDPTAAVPAVLPPRRRGEDGANSPEA